MTLFPIFFSNQIVDKIIEYLKNLYFLKKTESEIIVMGSNPIIDEIIGPIFPIVEINCIPSTLKGYIYTAMLSENYGPVTRE